MDYLNRLISKWMPSSSPRVAVDSHPRLSGIMDTINSTLAHGPETRLPSEFYDGKGRDIIDRIGTEEWFSGYQESTEYRKVGIGALLGDIVSRMAGSAEGNGNDGMSEVGGDNGKAGTGRAGEKAIKFAMSGCHDTTLAAILASLGAFEDEKWPPYTSHIALELFQKTSSPTIIEADPTLRNEAPIAAAGKQPWYSFIFGGSNNVATSTPTQPTAIARRPMSQLADAEKQKLNGYYVRVRYNDRVKTIPGCKLPGNHLEGDDSFCTLVRLLLSILGPFVDSGDDVTDVFDGVEGGVQVHRR